MNKLPAFDLKTMNIAQLEDTASLISDYLVNKTHFSVESLTRSLMVMEVTMALHHVFDVKKSQIVFDNLEESIVHRFLMGGYDDLTDFEYKHDFYQSSQPGYGLGVGCGLALESDGQIIVVIDDYALNYGTTFESLLQIATYNPDMIIVVIDEQNSLLRHYSSVDSIIKSVRISKTYTTLKKDVKMLLSNPVGKPLLGTMTKVRDGLKERIIEPTIFSQFGLEYKGPLNGSNLKECIRAFQVAKTLKGPQIFHVKTRLRRSFQSTVQFPKFKTDHSVPEGYKNYLEHIDNLLSERDDIIVFNDVIRHQDHLVDFAIKYPDHYIISSGSHNSLIDMMKGYSMKGNKCVLVMNSSDYKYCAPHIEEQFRESDDITIILRDAGLAPRPGRVNQGVFDLTYSQIFTNHIYMGKDIDETTTLLPQILDITQGVRILRIPTGLTGYRGHNDPVGLSSWTILNKEEVTEPVGVIFTYGPSVNQILNKIRVNNYRVWVVNCTCPLIGDEDVLSEVSKHNIPSVVYDLEDISASLFIIVSNYLGMSKSSNLSLHGTNLNLGSKDLKNVYHLNIEHALSIIIDK
ncbi:hypothetical protein AOC36_04890 [Erysipelothrix larvae]|uniref:Transketolase-like pyrimidine-binding domain-containing protein n=1 Tax=Erysipelothrix larvae TaxID=1514105 RepID=A0A0X8GZP6_9FIRM|nr:1-deoxy-D-xylulose-5-phosphate synthase N-terminal domain-containing protein [Erysipelothrix larvae]AMC93334.1 hypothetical protein AOC36_04890 [Erysipelothrix larvae]